MEKRITYISNFSRPLTFEDIEQIGETSVRNNKRDGLSGALFTFRNVFYQILEGEASKVDECYERISKDDRHKDIFMLNIEKNISSRKYEEWSMKTVILDEQTEAMIRPVRSMLDAISNTHRVLEKYAPKPVLNDIQQGGNPLEKKLFSTEKIILFSDLVGSTTLTESLPKKDMISLLDTYYNTVIKAVENAGGTVAKLTGDGLMAYFEPELAQQVIKAVVDALTEFKKMRALDPESYVKYLDTGFGIKAGRVLEGNIGSDLKKDYTLIGDAVNTAARLESVTRKVDRRLVFDESLVELLKECDYTIKKLGLYKPKGKEKRVSLYTIDHPAVEGIKSEKDIRELMKFDNKRSG